jgi:hypothetical protein
MNYKKLIGYYLDTSHLWTNKIIFKEDAERYIKEIISIYTEDHLKKMYLDGEIFTSYEVLENSINLHDFLHES